jgi:cyanate permease
MRVIAGSMIAMSVFTVLVPLVPGRVLVFITVALVGLSSLAYFSPRFAMVPEVVARPEDIGPATGLINTLGFTISMLAPWLFGLALDEGLGYVVAYVILAAFGAAGVVGVLFFRAPEGPRP